MKKILFLLAIVLMTSFVAITAKAQDQNIVGPKEVDVYMWHVLMTLPGYPGYEGERNAFTSQVRDHGHPTNGTLIVTNLLLPPHLWQPQAVGNQNNRSLAQVTRIVARGTNTITANSLRFSTDATIPGQPLANVVGFSSSNTVFSSNLIGISRSPSSPSFPHTGHTFHYSGTTLTQPVGEIITVFPLKYLPYPLDSMPAVLHLEPEGDTANLHLWSTAEYDDGRINNYSIRSLDSKPQPTNGFPRIVYSVSPTNPEVLHLKGLSEHDRSYVLEKSSSMTGTNWVAVGTGNNNDIWQIQNSPTNQQVFFRLRRL